jgi:hypothetical protein
MSLSNHATPEQFLTARVEVLDGEPRMTTLCAGFERGEWRESGFVSHLFDYLLEFAMKWSELRKLNSATAVRMIEDAARRVYETEKYGQRGEFGELLLHAALRSQFSSEPAVSKLFYKSADNDTVKGFDCVHVVAGNDGGLELWLGEAKFYADIGDAIRAALTSLSELTSTDRLKREFVLVSGLVDDDWPHAPAFKALISDRRSLDEVFQVLRIPVLLTYNSDVVDAATAVDVSYERALRAEVENILGRFKEPDRLPADIYVHLILVPLKDKDSFQSAMHSRLRELQG